MEKTIEVMRDKQVNTILLIASGILIIWKPEVLSYMLGLYLIIAGLLNMLLLYKAHGEPAEKAPSGRAKR